MKKFFKGSYLIFILLLVYVPIFVLILFSFNSSDSLSHFTGFSSMWYKYLFNDKSFGVSILLSLLIGVVTTLVSVVIGTMAALGISRLKKLSSRMILTVTNIPLINADVVTAVALMLMFVSFLIPTGVLTLLLAHISFDIPYVIILVLPKIRKIDNSCIEASLDLGAKPFQTLKKVVLPILKPNIISAAIVAFSMSFDDFIISYFNSGGDSNVSTFIYSLKRTEPYINAFATITIVLVALTILFMNIHKSMNKKKLNIEKSLSTNTYREKDIYKYENKLWKYYYMYNHFNNIKTHLSLKKIQQKIIHYENKINYVNTKIKEAYLKSNKKHKISSSDNRFLIVLNQSWRQILFLSISFILITALCISYFSLSYSDIVIANWGEYLSPTLIHKFEEETGLRVKYNQFASNEILYNKLYSYDKYDVMVPSLYMAIKMYQSSGGYSRKIQPIDYSRLNINGKKVIKSDFWNNNIATNLNIAIKNASKLHQNENSEMNISDYQIPYFWGDMRIIINPKQKNLDFLKKNHVKISADNVVDATSLNWNVFVNAAKDKNENIIISDDPKNVFLPESEILLNKVEPTTKKEVAEVYKASKWIKNKNISLQNDEITDSLISDNWDFALAYNGDALYSNTIRKNHNLIITYPNYENSYSQYQGTDVWEDGMVINKKSKHLNADYKFINFILSNQNEIAHSSDFIGYSSPLQKNLEKIGNDYAKENPIYKSAYTPNFYEKPGNLNPADGMFWYNLSDMELSRDYTELIAGKI